MGKSPPKDNLESWQDIQGFLAEFPQGDYGSRWTAIVRDTIAALERRGLSPLFRIGQSMHHIIFSTVDKHVLGSEPRVTLEFDPNEDIVRIAYGFGNLYFSDPASEERVAAVTAVPTILLYLRRLWKETKPDVPLPDALSGA